MKKIIFLITACFVAFATKAQQASFFAADTVGCVPFTCTFVNTSSNAASYIWTFSNGVTSSASNPTVIFNDTGYFDVQLIALSPTGLADTLFLENYIYVSAPPVVSFSAPAEVCKEETFFPQNMSQNASTFIWDFGDGNTSILENPAHQYTHSGNFNIALFAYNEWGCSAFHSASVYVKEIPDINVVSENRISCDLSAPVNISLSASDNSQINSVSWEIDNGLFTASGLSAQFNFNSFGNHDVKNTVSFTNGCVKELELEDYIQINESIVPQVVLSDSSGCVPFTTSAEIINVDAYAGIVWNNNGEGDVSETQLSFDDPGVYHISLTVIDTNGCSSAQVLENLITVSSPPVLNTNFPVYGCDNDTVLLQVFNPQASFVSWTIDNASFTGNTIQIPTTDKDLDVGLHVDFFSGCSIDTAISDFVKIINPSAAMIQQSATTGCVPFSVDFSLQNPNLYSAVTWYFDNDTSASVYNPSITFSNAGVYGATIITESTTGCIDTINAGYLVHAKNSVPVNLNVDTISGCSPLSVNLSAQNIGYNYWEWKTDSIVIGTDETLVYSFETPGIHAIQLSSENYNGCPFTQNFAVAEVLDGDADFIVQNISCNSKEAVIIDAKGNVASAQWDFGDGTVETGTNVGVHTYENYGFYTAFVSYITNDGCPGVEGVSLSFAECLFSGSLGAGSAGLFAPMDGDNIPDSVLIVPDSATMIYCGPVDIHFSCPLPQDSVSACFWDFGDGTTSTEINPEHIYNQSGTFDLYIEITLNNGNVQALEIPQFLNLYVPEANFNYAVNNMCEGGIVNFSASHAGDWNFGDGGYAYNSSQPVHTYTENGVYNVKFIVNDNPYGCVLENIKTVSLNKENFLFSFPDKVCAGEPFSVQTNISGYQSYSWEVSNGTVMPGLNTYFSLNESGTYFLTLYASKGNCTDTFYIEQPVRVIAPKADFSVLSPVVCDSGIVQLQNLSENASSFEWNVSNGDYSSNIEPSFSFTTVGTYNITLTAIQDGCRDTKIVESAVWVNPSPMVDFSVSAANNCYPVTVSVTDMSPGIVSQRVWNFNDGQTLLNTPSAVHTFLDSTVKTIKLTVTDSLGCVSSLEKPNILPYKGVISVDSITGCIPKTVYLHNSAPNSVQQTWIFGDGSFSNNNNVQHVYSDSGFYQILLISEYSQGCLDTAMLPYKIRVKEVKAVFSQNTSQLQGCIPLLVNYSDESVNALSWAWDFGDSTYSSVQNPGHIFFTPGEYTTRLVVTDLQGCYDTAFAPNPITALGPHISAAVDTVEGCGSLETHFLNNPETGVDYTWIFGDGNIKNSPTASHIYSPGVYVPFVTAIDTNNCEVTVPLDTITVHQLPEIEIQTIANHECVPFNVQLEVATPQDSMIWQVADTSFVNTPVFNFPMEKDTSYLVFVQLTDDNQCSSDTSIIISGNPVPDADFYSPDTSFSCFPANLHLTYNGKSEDSLQYIWSVGGLTFNSPSPVILLKDSGKYDVSLTVTNSFGCSASIRKENYFSLNDVEAPENSRIFSLVVSDDNNNLLVEWEKSNAEDFKDYTLYVSAYGEYLYRIAKTENNIAATQANLSHLNLENGIYNFKIQTMDICGNKIPLSELPEYNTILLQGNADTNQINLKWNRYKIAPFEKFVVMEKSPFQNNFAPIAFLSPDSLAYWTQKFFCKSGYSYKIIAENTYNTGYYSASNTITLYPENPYLHAQKVTITRTTVIDNDNEHFVLNEWKAPSVFPEAVKNYYLYRTTSASNKELLAVLPPYQTSFADYNVAVDDSSYIYTIEVENTCNVRGEKGNISNSILLNYQTTGNDVILNWNGYKGWGNHNLEKYLIRKKVNDSEWKTIYEASPTERFFKDDILKK